MWRVVHGVGVAGVGGITLLGLLAPIWPAAEIVNHFRPYLLAAALVLLAAAILRLGHLQRRWAAGVVALNAALAAVPLAFGAWPQMALSSGAAEAKIVSLNLWRSEEYEAISTYIESEAPQIVVLQELSAKHIDALLPRLKAQYSHQAVCDECGLAVLAKTPLKIVDVQPGVRPWLGVLWSAPSGTVYRVFGVHLPWPFEPAEQASEVDALGARLRSSTEPVVVAGDFNLTPWSWKLNKLAWSSGLTRQGTFAFSWPVHSQFKWLSGFRKWPLPSLVLIDNVLTPRGVTSAGFSAGPNLGSDHRPVVARLRLP